ncbi:MAG TPA: hypothetical protein PKE45_22420, partial [Caldilineaceae bacterium]|nr:hypothetical protein [Caldilineaceae bacterium]
LTSTPTVTATSTLTATPTASITSTATNTGTVTPTPTPTPDLPYDQAVVASCLPAEDGTRFSGTVTLAGQPVDGVRVVFRFGEGYGDPATAPAITGPPNDPGVYHHIIRAGSAVAGQWSAWLVDAGGAPLSVYATFTTDGPGGACNVVTVNFAGGESGGRAGQQTGRFVPPTSPSPALFCRHANLIKRQGSDILLLTR